MGARPSGLPYSQRGTGPPSRPRARPCRVPLQEVGDRCSAMRQRPGRAVEHRPDTGRPDLGQQVQDPAPRPRGLVGRTAARQVAGQLRGVQGELRAKWRILEGRGAARVPGRARPVRPGPTSTAPPGPPARPRRRRTSTRGRRPTRPARRTRAPGPAPARRPVRSPAPPSRPPRAAPAATAAAERAQRRRPAVRLRGAHRLARPARVPGEEGRVAEGVRLQARRRRGPGPSPAPPRSASGRRRSGRSRGPASRPRWPVHRRPRAAGPRSTAGWSRVEQRVGGAQRLGGPAVEAVRAVPVVQQPDLAYGVLDGGGLGARPGGGAAGGRGARAARRGRARRRPRWRSRPS